IGGGASDPGVLDTAWAALRPGGRMVANAVTLETESLLGAAWSRHGGALTRIGIERLGPVGGMHGVRPGMPVTQWAATKR
ncbi:MAG: bifunctional cobalt-precorrin-7 (C(5))-methyltransferase/cobalt-precorrin-6B (C(15))-methyltransferase, partial [Acetobacteraceae bacterium]|nr:bifunctional cobalt-precorrin-7 (C(5))-methyltransferase/cobalt-precorrin-6B (C(15))-methyltransferase [Acetobacteraceae bacterium]